MTTLLQGLSVAICLLTGIYYFILFRYKGNERNALWFPILCLAFAIHLNFRIGVDNTELSTVLLLSDLDILDNFYIASQALCALAINLYASSCIYLARSKWINLFDILCLIIAGVSFIASGSFLSALYYISGACLFIGYMYGLVASFRMYKLKSKLYVYSIISYALLIVGFFPGVILALFDAKSFSLRAILIPIYIILHVIMLTRQYRESIYKTSDLAKSLEETIEKIGHSDNALICTQMKQDFLNDTLDLISEKCGTDPYTAEDLTVSLSKYLRHTLNFQQLKGVVPLSNELELTRAYIAIEKEKHPGVEFVTKIPNPAPDILIPPLTIQPLIENALEHGILKDRTEGKISLTITIYHEYCHIDVSDNGIGIPENELSRIPGSYTTTARIGLYNIHTRLIARYGKGLVIQSSTGVGTSVSFVVPPDSQLVKNVKAKANEEVMA